MQEHVPNGICLPNMQVLPPDPTWRDETVVQTSPLPEPSLVSGPSVQLLLPEDQQASKPESDSAIVKAFEG